jgi:hypothetical protein
MIVLLILARMVQNALIKLTTLPAVANVVSMEKFAKQVRYFKVFRYQ